MRQRGRWTPDLISGVKADDRIHARREYLFAQAVGHDAIAAGGVGLPALLYCHSSDNVR